mmetsp:Transcript_42821/g.84783  ORF Transcript_42821/g.84783 Transcript_42821/m.84783 type:complete len:236 (-) Transcript_42821:518-1225(-)
MTSQKGIKAFRTVGAGAAVVALGTESRAFVTLPATADAAPLLRTRSSVNQSVEKQCANASSRMSGALVLGATAACAVTVASRRRAAVGRARDLDSPHGARVVVADRGEMNGAHTGLSSQMVADGFYLVSKLREFGHKVMMFNRGKTNEGKPDRLPRTSAGLGPVLVPVPEAGPEPVPVPVLVPVPGLGPADCENTLEDVTVLKADRKADRKAAVAAADKLDFAFDNNLRTLILER